MKELINIKIVKMKILFYNLQAKLAQINIRIRFYNKEISTLII